MATPELPVSAHPAPPSRAKRVLARVKGAAPWAATIGAFLYVGLALDYDTLERAAREADLSAFLLRVAVANGVAFVVNLPGYFFLLNRFLGPISWRHATAGRGATLLFEAVNYNLGQAAFAWLLSKRHGLPFVETLGAMGFIAYIDLSLYLAAGGLLLGLNGEMGSEAGVITVAMGVGVALVWSFWRQAISRATGLNLSGRLHARLAALRFFAVFSRARTRDYLLLALLRLPVMLCISGMFYFFFPVFGLRDITLARTFRVVPLAALSSALSVGGLGVPWVVMGRGFGFAPESREMAALGLLHVAEVAAWSVMQMAWGLVFLRTALAMVAGRRDIARLRDAAATDAGP
ncbi:MAG: hypothetical protein HY719_15095 [Planctomycetes bacterium]|nr:hypothetical protein [Planctomycetota bacterium]